MLSIFTVYGPRQRPDTAFHRFIKAMLRDEFIHIYGEGSQMRDFTYIGDVVNATIKAIESDDVVGEVINIGSSRPVKFINAVNLIANILGIKPK